jgi:signal transduction histidine kinase
VTGPDGRFAGFKGEALGEGNIPPPTVGAGSPFDQVIDEALRSPLDRIIDSADRIVQQADGPLRSDYADYASDIAGAARHLLSVIRSMNGEAIQDQDRVNLVALANEAAGLVENQAEPRGIVVAVEPREQLEVRGDARGVIQILVNLVGNAVRHSPDHSTVAVSFEEDHATATVHVLDEGPGIDPADQQRIFERFERASEGGTGLGLAIARRLARSMGGDIALQSVPGEGARFSLSLPLAS